MKKMKVLTFSWLVLIFTKLSAFPVFAQSDPGAGDLTTDSFLNSVNPLAVGVNQGPPNFLNFLAGIFNIARFRTPGQVLSALFPWLFTFAGLILFVMLLWGGFEMLSGAATPNSQEAGKNRIQAAVLGFFLLFITYWIAQIIQTIFGVNILGQ